MDSDSVGAGVAERSPEAELNSAVAIKKHSAATIATSNFNLLKRINAFSATLSEANLAACEPRSQAKTITPSYSARCSARSLARCFHRRFCHRFLLARKSMHLDRCPASKYCRMNWLD